MKEGHSNFFASRSSWFILIFVLFFGSVTHAQWTVELTREATMLIRYDGATVVRAKYVAWGPQWKYAEFKSAIGKNDNESWPITGQIDLLNLKIDGSIKHEPEKLTFTWNLNASKASQDNTGGGLSFDLRLDPQIFGPDTPKPVIDGRGWRWSPKPNETIAVSFEGMDRDSYFEKNQPSEIRSMFVPQDISAGAKTVKMTLTLPPGTKRVDGVSKRYANFDPKTWHAKTVDWTTSPVDLSYLNEKPAGGHGFVKADRDRLVFADGTEARFWGTNVMAYALFNATDAAIEQQSKRLAMLGFNLVRIHHHDSAEWSPSVFVKDSKDTIALDEKNLDRIDYWVKCLREQGIYVWLDLHINRPFREGDGIEGFDELKPGKTGRTAKGFNYVNPKITERMKEFAAAYLTRTNKYTGLKYVDEPAVMGILITNENDLTNHFGNEMLPNKNKPVHQKWFEALRNKVVADRGLNSSEAWKTWEAGDSKIVLNQIEYDWNIDFIAHLRGIGVKVPIATTNTWGANPLYSLPALTAGDVVDAHAYGQAESLSSNPNYDDMSSHWLAAAQVAGKPVTITEWNTEYPQKDRFTQPLFIASQAAFQGWDAPMIYGYQQAPLVPQTKIEEFGIANDPAMISLMPAAALIFRQQHVKPAEKTVVFAPGEALLTKTITPENSPALRTIAERHRLVIGLPGNSKLPWLKGVKSDESDPQSRADGVGESSITSDTNELSRDWKTGLYTINTPLTQAAMGWIGDQEIAMLDATFKINTPKATVAISSLDGQPIGTSKRMLLSFAAQTNVSGTPAKVSAESVTGQVIVKSPVTVEPLSPQGKPLTRYENVTSIGLGADIATHWFLLTRP